MASHTRGTPPAQRKPNSANDTTESGKRDSAFDLLKKKTAILQGILEIEKRDGKLSEDDQRRKRKLREIIETQLGIYKAKKGNNKDMIALCNRLLKESQGR